jgi:hypothetical protein
MPAKKVDNRLEMFKDIKKMLSKYEPPLVATSDFESRYELTATKEVVFAGRKRPGVYFGAAIIQSNYVGFYLMSVYADPKLTKQMPAELMKTLKGKSCFHIKTLDATLKKQIAEALKISFDFYKKQGWV